VEKKALAFVLEQTGYYWPRLPMENLERTVSKLVFASLCIWPPE